MQAEGGVAAVVPFDSVWGVQQRKSQSVYVIADVTPMTMTLFTF